MLSLCAVVTLAGPACGQTTRPIAAPQRPVRAPAGKAALYGDASLIPTRAGEHARSELALSTELWTAVEAMPGVGSATVAVRTPPTCLPMHAPSGPGRPVAIATLTTAPGTDADALRAEVQTLAQGWLGPDADVRIVLASEPTPPAPSPVPLPWLIVTVLGLGASVGITVDRAADRTRRRTARARRGRPAA